MTHHPLRLIGRAAIASTAMLSAACTHQPQPSPSGVDAGAPGVIVAEYRCDNGARVHATYPTRNTALVRYRGNINKMRIARSADGARYTNDVFEWWTKGSGQDATATLFAHRQDGTTGEILRHCRQTNPR